MAGWVPSKKSVGGLYAGRDFLTSNMNYWLDYSEVTHSGDYLYARAQGWGGQARVSGTIGDEYIDHKINNPADSDDLICEFKVKAPRNRQFDYHTIKIYFESSFNYRDYRGQQFYEISDINIRFAKKVYYNDGTSTETSIGSQRTAWVTIARYILNWMNAWGMGFNNPNQLVISTGNITYNDITYYCFGININANNTSEQYANRIFGLPVSQLATAFDVDEFEEDVITDPNYDESDASNDVDWKGGDGDHDNHSDEIDEPDILQVGAASSGLVTLYVASSSLIRQFASSLWDFNFITEILKFFTNPLDWIVSVKMVPFVPVATEAAYIKWGVFTFPTPLSLLPNQYYELDCGNVSIAEYWGNCFDYDPYTRVEIWLPYIGYRDLPVDLVMRHSIHCRYEIDCLTGCCCAIISTDATDDEDALAGSDVKKVIGQYYGNCAVEVPLSSASNAGFVQTMMAATGAFLNKAVPAFAQQALQPPEEYSDYEAALNVGAGYISAMGTTIKNVTAMKTTASHSGNAGMSAGAMSVQTPFINITRPNQSRPDNFIDLHGYMSNMAGTLSEFTGYAQVEDIQLNNVPAFEPELKEIIKLLKGGIII